MEPEQWVVLHTDEDGDRECYGLFETTAAAQEFIDELLEQLRTTADVTLRYMDPEFEICPLAPLDQVRESLQEFLKEKEEARARLLDR